MPEALLEGFQLLLSNLWLVPVGVLAGMFYGAMPGLTSSGTLAMLLPILIVISPEKGLILGVSMYAGAEMGNSFPSVMMNIPGTPAGAVTAFDGYPMMQKGEASRALGICILASTLGAMMAGIAALIFAPSIAEIALKFGPPEISIVIIFGLAVIAQLSAGGFVKGLLSGFVGLSLATTGTDPTFGQFRGTFGMTFLFDKLPIVAVLIGLLGLSEALFHAQSGATTLLRKEGGKAQVSAAHIWQGLKIGFRDVLARQAVGIAGSIPSFVVRASDGDRQLKSGSPGQERRTPDGVIFHHRPLSFRELARTGQDLPGNANLPNVMENGRQAQLLHIVIRIPKFSCQSLC